MVEYKLEQQIEQEIENDRLRKREWYNKKLKNEKD